MLVLVTVPTLSGLANARPQEQQCGNKKKNKNTEAPVKFFYSSIGERLQSFK